MKQPYRKWILMPIVVFSIASFPAKAQDKIWGTINSPTGPALVPQASDVAASVLSVAFTGRVDHVASGVGLRNQGEGTIRLRGAPATGSAELGILYFGFICSGPCPTTQAVFFQGLPVTGIRIGTDTQPCWLGTAYGAYSVNVTSLLSPGINDDYVVGGVPSFLTDGSDPWVSPGSAAPLAEGASLVVIYSEPSLSPGAVYVNEGAVFFFSTVNIDNPVSPPLLGSFRRLTSIGADGQVGNSTFATPPISGEKTFIGPGVTALNQIAGPGGQNQDSDWNGHDGVPLNQLWDTNTHSFSAAILPAGTTSYRVRYESNGDCMDWTAHVLTAR